MTDIWFIGDTHLGHTNILKFLKEDGFPLRPFKSTWEMEGVIFERWCEVVKPEDTVYHLGDVAFTQDALFRMRTLPGKKQLIRGNHDGFSMNTYLDVFDNVYGVKTVDRYWLSHVPMHTCSIGRAKLNIHGHLHAGHVRHPDGMLDKRYYNVSVEQIDYRPINFDSIREYWKRNVSSGI